MSVVGYGSAESWVPLRRQRRGARSRGRPAAPFRKALISQWYSVARRRARRIGAPDRDHIADALDETRFRAFARQMQDSAEAPLTGSIERGVDSVARRFGLVRHEKDAVLRNLIEGAAPSLWGLSNAVTAAAALPDYDRATELEAVGGRLLELTAAEAREILAA